MAPSLLMAVEYGGYVSIVKLVVFLGLFLLWPWFLGWAHKDARAVGAHVAVWVGAILGAGALGFLLWCLVPIYLAGLLAYAVVLGGVALAYVRYRNTRVLDFDRLLTVDHLKSLVSKSEKLAAMEDFMFITARNNEVPKPEPRTPVFFGYRTAYDIVTDAAWRRASTVTFTPKGETYEVVYSIDGTPTRQPAMPREQMEYLLYFLKEVAGLDSKEKRKPQKGKFRSRQNKENTDWEVMTAGSTAGEQVRLTRITKESALRLPDLGLAPDQLEQMERFRTIEQGVLLVTGPRKSGATTTMYALVRNHDAFLNSINTIERQVLSPIVNVTQTVYTLTDTGTTTYAKRLQTIVRMGCSIVGVGECEDPETAKVIGAAARDGKLIYVVMEADSVLQALGKWLKMVEDRKLVAETLLGISNQRLFRKLCATCKQGYAPNKELLKKFNLPADKAKVLYRPGKEVFDKRGKPSVCQTCQGTGFVGRTGVFETIMLDDPELKKAVRTVKQLPELGMEFRRRAKMLYLQEQALRKTMAGTTAINEMLRVLATGKKQASPAAQ
ncbi:MAG: Flp pilus assembly complex ATPase component TadA [Planctomycetes bacterium]|jgi:type II secretory ATPase GspE/PulE/Tfp pilus assembly ATPase PilB-like protein|nr:Flp pilus assembly complex ATPase component TadA [Planctomycetota bacterium]